MSMSSPASVDGKAVILDQEDFEYKDDEEGSSSDFLGSGAFSEVFKARLKSVPDGALPPNPKIVAAKVLTKPSKPRLKESDFRMFNKEAAILMKMRPHRNVVSLYGVCLNPKHFVLLLEYMDGGSLDDWLYYPEDPKTPKPLDIQLWQHRINIACQIAEGLAHLHTNKPPVAHMDMKCGNVLLKVIEQEFLCKITDFGLSKMKDVSTRSRRQTNISRRVPPFWARDSHGKEHGQATAEAHGAGTMQYMAPEQYTGTVEDWTENQRALVDVHSFGLMLWELLEKAAVFQGMAASVVMAHKKDNYLPKPKQKYPVCANEYEKLMKDCYNFDPKKRPPSSYVLGKLLSIKEEVLAHIVSDSEPRSAFQESGEQLAIPGAYAQAAAIISPSVPMNQPGTSGWGFTRGPSPQVQVQATDSREILRDFHGRADQNTGTSMRNPSTHGSLLPSMPPAMVEHPLAEQSTQVIGKFSDREWSHLTFTFTEAQIQIFLDKLKKETENRSDFNRAATMILKCIAGILDNPEEEKFRRIYTENKRFGFDIWRHSTARALLLSIGFENRKDKRILLPFSANLKGLKLLRRLLEIELVPSLAAATVAVTPDSPKADCAAIADEADGGCGTVAASSSLASGQLNVVGILASLLGFLNSECCRGQGYQCFPSVVAEVRVLLTLLVADDQESASFIQHWERISEDPMPIEDHFTLQRCQNMLDSFSTTITDRLKTKFGEKSEEVELFQYLRRISRLSPLLKSAIENPEIIGLDPEYVQGEYLKFPDIICRNFFSAEFLIDIETVELRYQTFIHSPGQHQHLAKLLIVDVVWINFFFLNHFYSDSQLKMKTCEAFSSRETWEKFDAVLELAEELRKYLLMVFAHCLCSSSQYFDGVFNVLSKLGIATCTDQGLVLKLEAFVKTWSGHQETRKIREFWMLEQAIGATILSEVGIEYAKVFFLATSYCMLTELWNNAETAREVDQVLVTWHSFVHRSAFFYFRKEMAEKLQAMARDTEKDFRDHLEKGGSLSVGPRRIQDSLFFVCTNFRNSLKPPAL